MSTLSYSIDGMRVTKPTTKVAAAHPDRLFTVLGKAFYPVDEKGKRGDKLSITSKNVDREDATGEGFSIDLVKGTLTLPTAQRGRKASEGISADELTALLAGV